MKKILLIIIVVISAITSSCEGPQGPQGPPGYTAESEVIELLNVSFDANREISRSLDPPILDSDVILIYRLSGTFNPQTPIWQLIPRTLYFNDGELDYDYEFSRINFTIYVGGTYEILPKDYIQNQTFRIVIIPGYFSKNSVNKVDYNNYDEVIKFYNIDDSHVKVLN